MDHDAADLEALREKRSIKKAEEKVARQAEKDARQAERRTLVGQAEPAMKAAIEASEGLVYPCLANPRSGNVNLFHLFKSLEFFGNISQHLYRLREADTSWLAGKWDVVKGLRDGVEKAWLEKDVSYVQGDVAAEVKKYEDINEGARKWRDNKRNRCQGSAL